MRGLYLHLHQLGVRSGMLRGVARLVLVGDKYEYKEELVSDRAVGEIVLIFLVRLSSFFNKVIIFGMVSLS